MYTHKQLEDKIPVEIRAVFKYLGTRVTEDKSTRWHNRPGVPP